MVVFVVSSAATCPLVQSHGFGLFREYHQPPNPRWRRRRRPPLTSPDGRSYPTPSPRPAPTYHQRSSSTSSHTRELTVTVLRPTPAGSRDARPSESFDHQSRHRQYSGPGGTPELCPASRRAPDDSSGPRLSCSREGC